jgi:hypothetical protein
MHDMIADLDQASISIRSSSSNEYSSSTLDRESTPDQIDWGIVRHHLLVLDQERFHARK